MSSKPDISQKIPGDLFLASELNTIVDFFAGKQDNNGLLVLSVADLSPYLVGDEYILPEGLVQIGGTVDLGDKAVRISTNTILRGLGAANLVSTNTNGVIRCTNVSSNVIIREVNVICYTGPCLVLTGTIDFQLNLFFMGLIGIEGGTITGFNVQSIKQLYVQAAKGLTLAGVTNKVFLSETPFYNVSTSAVILDSTLNANVADIVSNFFKFDSPGTGITAEAGYTVGAGFIRGNLIDGTATPLNGLAPSDIQWKMTDNSGIADSRIVGGFYLVTSALTDITATNTPVKMAGTTTAYVLNERFTSTNNRITYTGLEPAVITMKGTVSIGSGNNDQLGIYIYKNGIKVPESFALVRVGNPGDVRNAFLTAIEGAVTGDYFEIWAENRSNGDDITALTLNLDAIA